MKTEGSHAPATRCERDSEPWKEGTNQLTILSVRIRGSLHACVRYGKPRAVYK